MSIDTQKHNRIRQLILRIAFREYPKALDALVLRATLADFCFPMNEKDLAIYLSYLQEKGYVRLYDQPEYGIHTITITAQGIDVMDGRIKDVSIGCEGLQ